MKLPVWLDGCGCFVTWPHLGGSTHEPALAQSWRSASVQDSQEDVRAVSAEALLPAAEVLASRSDEDMQHIHRALWATLRDADELSPAAGDPGDPPLAVAETCVWLTVSSMAHIRRAGSVMQLLLQLQRCPSGGTCAPRLGQVLQRLWPLFRHPLASVRLAATRLLASIVTRPPAPGTPLFLLS